MDPCYSMTRLPANICTPEQGHFVTAFRRATLKGGPQLADRVETADHIQKDATGRYAPRLRGGPLHALF